MNQTRNSPYNHGESYAVMTYATADGTLVEKLWNSRDGVTPFAIHSPDGRDMTHAGNWRLDPCEPFYVPPIGSRIFVDLTPELARPLAQEYVDKAWNQVGDYAMKDHPFFAPMGKAGAVDYFIKEWCEYGGGHSPLVVVVTREMHDAFALKRQMGGHSHL